MTGKETNNKLNLSLVPPELIRAVAHIREYGCKKYSDPDNWKQVPAEMFNQAMQRHMMAAWTDWKSIDEESGMPHIWHIATNAAFLCAIHTWEGPGTEEKELWTPIDAEEKPGTEFVLVSFENCSTPDIARYEKDEEGNGTFYPGDEEKSYLEYGLFVNAWRPLPKCYRGGE